MRRLVFAAHLLSLLVISACSDGGEGSGGDPADVMAHAKKALDETSGVQLLLTTPELPDGVSGVTKAEGIATHQPGFEGSIDIVYSGFTGTIPVKAVEGQVYAILPFTKQYNPVDPAEYNAPDPAGLIDPDGGISAWLTKADNLEETDSVRDGEDVLTSYEGTLSGSAVVTAIPSADDNATFQAAFALDEDGRLRTATVTGPFYSGQDSLTYVVTLSKYGTDKQITAP